MCGVDSLFSYEAKKIPSDIFHDNGILPNFKSIDLMLIFLLFLLFHPPSFSVLNGGGH
jgi:hypothetical protein